MSVVLGIDLGGTALKWAVRPPDATARDLIAHGSMPTGADRTAIVAAMTDLVHRVDVEHGRVHAVGVGVPGHVDRATGVVRFLPNVSGDWGGFPLGAALRRDTGRPITVLNDARAFCLAELTMGAARGRRDALFLTLGTGVGGGVAVGGRLLVGSDDRLGEIGHLTYDRSGPRCGCGNRGCLELYASGPALVRGLRERTGRRPDSPRAVVAAADAGDGPAAEVLARAGRAIGETLASLCAVLPAEVAVIGGGVAAGLPALRPHIERALAERAEFIGPVAVVAAALGPMAGALGAALAASSHPDEPSGRAATGRSHRADEPERRST
ncbi:ROK family protein [Plantactinospora soyae]|uniref:Glucokinase n=1 Tax=Plantactinospora soyae TaxID=1544732 RepID=A0A927MAQ1_9ACTN|nr:ROK family protein [Plantactinospora soyae]MBE1489681.1 glucokinase [Plantactinospora soyae]